jgi:hypothetical protein
LTRARFANASSFDLFTEVLIVSKLLPFFESRFVFVSRPSLALHSWMLLFLLEVLASWFGQTAVEVAFLIPQTCFASKSLQRKHADKLELHCGAACCHAPVEGPAVAAWHEVQEGALLLLTALVAVEVAITDKARPRQPIKKHGNADK